MMQWLNNLWRKVTLEQLHLSEEDNRLLKTLSQRQRVACYSYLTAHAYRLNNDVDRMSALRIRDLFMKDTKSDKNVIPFDRERKIPSISSFLPDAMKHADIS